MPAAAIAHPETPAPTADVLPIRQTHRHPGANPPAIGSTAVVPGASRAAGVCLLSSVNLAQAQGIAGDNPACAGNDKWRNIVPKGLEELKRQQCKVIPTVFFARYSVCCRSNWANASTTGLRHNISSHSMKPAARAGFGRNPRVVA